MLSNTYTPRILDLARQKGLLRASDLDHHPCAPGRPDAPDRRRSARKGGA